MTLGDIVSRAPWADDLAPFLVLATAFCEALVVIGLFVPLTPLLVALGAVIAAGSLEPGIVAWAIVGAFTGNLASYVLGRGHKAARHGLPGLPPKALVQARRLFERHGAAAIVVSRYLGPPATIAPFLAGWAGLPWPRFILANLVASLTWPLTMTTAGYAATSGWRWMSAGWF